MAIYEPKGAAREYCALALNLYAGCSHGCTYCYAPSAVRRQRADFIHATPRKDIIAKVEKAAPAFSGTEVHLCFTCDPYQPIESQHLLAAQTLEIFNRHNIRARILTKGATLAMRDFDLLKQNGGTFGVTLTYDNAYQTRKMEPWADNPSQRIEALRRAKEKGIPTWASFEPVLDPEQALRLIEQTNGLVDEYKVGKWNHDARAKDIDWSTFARQAVELLEKIGANYYIKNELRKYL